MISALRPCSEKVFENDAKYQTRMNTSVKLFFSIADICGGRKGHDHLQVQRYQRPLSA